MAMLNPGSEIVQVTGAPSAYQRSGEALVTWRRLAARTESPAFGFPRVPVNRRPLVIGPRIPADIAALPDVVPVVPPPPIDPDTPVPGVPTTPTTPTPGPAGTSAAAPTQAGMPWWLGLALLGAVLLAARD